MKIAVKIEGTLETYSDDHTELISNLMDCIGDFSREHDMCLYELSIKCEEANDGRQNDR